MVAEDVRRERERIVREHMVAENEHRYADAIATFADHPRYEIIPFDRVHDGRAAVEEYFRESRTAFPDQRNELIAMHHADDAVITEFWLLGTHQGPLMGMAPSGKSFRCRMVALFCFAGTKLVCERVYFDSATILKQIAP